MRKVSFSRRLMSALLSLSLFLLVGCGNSGDSGPSMADIPVYPGAETGESMEQHFPAGMMGGSLKQYSTTDSFDEVVDFYIDAMSPYSTEVIDQPSQLGRQKAISVLRENGVITVAIQEFTAENTVNITFMQVGN